MTVGVIGELDGLEALGNAPYSIPSLPDTVKVRFNPLDGLIVLQSNNFQKQIVNLSNVLVIAQSNSSFDSVLQSLLATLKGSDKPPIVVFVVDRVQERDFNAYFAESVCRSISKYLKSDAVLTMSPLLVAETNVNFFMFPEKDKATYMDLFINRILELNSII